MWTAKDLEQKKRDGKIRGFQMQTKNFQKQHKNSKKRDKIPVKRSKEKDWLSWNLQYWCNERALELVPEYRFDTGRKWRSDWAIPAIKCLVEYEGLLSAKSRHTTVSGYTSDSEKYNRAQQLGWRVIRVTALNYKTVLQILNQYVPA